MTLDTGVKIDWLYQWIQGPYILMIFQMSLKQNKNILLPFSILLSPKDLLLLWLILLHSWQPQQVQFHFKWMMYHMHPYVSTTSAWVSPYSSNRKYPVFFIHNLNFDPYVNGMTDIGLSIKLLSCTTCWRFHPQKVFLRDITLPVYGYWSFKCGNWPTVTRNPSY